MRAWLSLAAACSACLTSCADKPGTEVPPNGRSLSAPVRIDTLRAIDRVPAGYALRGFASYSSMTYDGTLALLVGSGGIIDTIDARFGVHSVGADSIVFQPVRSGSNESERWQEATEHVLYHDGTRIPLGTLMPYLSSCFSQPSVLNGDIYYWGLSQGDNIRTYAARFDFSTRVVDTLELLDFELPATDECELLAQPTLEASGIRFGPYIVGSNFRSATRRAP